MTRGRLQRAAGRLIWALALAAAVAVGHAGTTRAQGHGIATNKGPDAVVVTGKAVEGLSLQKCKDDCRKKTTPRPPRSAAA